MSCDHASMSPPTSNTKNLTPISLAQTATVPSTTKLVYLVCGVVLLVILDAALDFSQLGNYPKFASTRGVSLGFGGGASARVLRQLPADLDGAIAPPPLLNSLDAAPRIDTIDPHPWMQPRDEMEFAQLIRDDPLARQSHWWECLASSLDPMCVPDSTARTSVPSFSEWKQHTHELLRRTRRFRGLPPFTYFNSKYNSSRYNGPWVENHFISSFMDTGKMELFYPLVPLFVQWTDVVLGDSALASELRVELFNPDAPALTKGMLYVTVMQMDRVPADSQLPCSALRNVLVMSAAGWGSVPIPLIKGFYKPHNHHYWPPSTDPVKYHRRKFVAAFVGEEKLHGHDQFRKAMKTTSLPLDSTMIYNHDMWMWMVHGAVFLVSQRGYDRAAYRTYETLQYGRIVLLVYNDGDTPWVPYQHVADFIPPNDLRRSRWAGEHPERFGAVLSSASSGPPDSTTASEAVVDPALWTHVLNHGGMWGPGGVGFAVSYSQLGSFFCVACEFILPGSAAKWRRVRTLPLHKYGKGAGLECPCSSATAWQAAAAMLPGPSTLLNMSLPEDSLVYEMERRVLGVSGQYFTYDAIMAQIEAYVVSPAEAALKCVPRPATVLPCEGSACNSSRQR